MLYLLNLIVVLHLYSAGKKCPSWCWVFLILSKRIHSIFMLRMFNDCVAVFFGYLAVTLFLQQRWRIGSLFYSLSVSIKMNMLLQAPGIFLVLLFGAGFRETIICISLCGLLQVFLGLPFLTTFPVSYITRSFDLGRSFMYKWTVNLKFLPEQIFLSKSLSLALLALTVVTFLAFSYKWCIRVIGVQRVTKTDAVKTEVVKRNLTSNFVIYTIFVSNFIGIVFARTLHYQFYSWYFHTLPYLLWQVSLPNIVRVGVLLSIEVAFNVYPATYWSSMLLQISHAILLGAVFYSSVPHPYTNAETSPNITLLPLPSMKSIIKFIFLFDNDRDSASHNDDKEEDKEE